MKKSTWKKLFTRSKSKSATRSVKKGKQPLVSCNVCAGVAVVNTETLCSSHRNAQNQSQAAVPPQGAVSTDHTIPTPVPQSSKKASEVKDAATEPSASAVSPAEKDQKDNKGLQRSAPVNINKPQPLARSSTNEDFMTEEVESQNLSDNSRTEENLETVNEGDENNDGKSPAPGELKVSSGTQEQQRASETDVPSGSHGLGVRRAGTPAPEEFKSPSRTLEEQTSAISPEHEPPIEIQVSPSSQHRNETPASTVTAGPTSNLNVLPEWTHYMVDKTPVGAMDVGAKKQRLGVEPKNQKNSVSVADLYLNLITTEVPAQPLIDSQSHGRQVETTSSSNKDFMAEEVTNRSGTSAEGEEVHPESSPQLSATTIPKHDGSISSHRESNTFSNQALEIVEVEEQEAGQGSRRLSMDASNINAFGSNKTPSLVKGVSKDSSEDLKPGVLQAQRSSKLNISFSEHVSLMAETKGNDEAISRDSLEETIVETNTTSITMETTDVTYNRGTPSGAQDIKMSSGLESEEALLAPPEDEDLLLEGDSGMGSDESSTSGPKESAEETSIQQNAANNPRPTPTIIFGTVSGPEQENDWSQPLFFGPNSLAQGMTLNVSNRDRESSQMAEFQGPFPGFGIISIVRDLYESDSSASQVQESKVTEVTEGNKKEEEAEGSSQEPPSLEDEEKEPESYKEVTKKQE